VDELQPCAVDLFQQLLEWPFLSEIGEGKSGDQRPVEQADPRIPDSDFVRMRFGLDLESDEEIIKTRQTRMPVGIRV